MIALRKPYAGRPAPAAGEHHAVILYLRVPAGMSAEARIAMRDVLDGSAPDGWWFLDPDAYLAAFLSAHAGMRRADDCIAAVETIRPLHQSLLPLVIGRAEGKLVATFDERGGFASKPTGRAVNDAMRFAAEYASGPATAELRAP